MHLFGGKQPPQWLLIPLISLLRPHPPLPPLSRGECRKKLLLLTPLCLLLPPQPPLSKGECKQKLLLLTPLSLLLPPQPPLSRGECKQKLLYLGTAIFHLLFPPYQAGATGALVRMR